MDGGSPRDDFHSSRGNSLRQFCNNADISTLESVHPYDEGKGLSVDEVQVALSSERCFHEPVSADGKACDHGPERGEPAAQFSAGRRLARSRHCAGPGVEPAAPRRKSEGCIVARRAQVGGNAKHRHQIDRGGRPADRHGTARGTRVLGRVLGRRERGRYA